jgi:hypothetical protein
MSIKRLLLSRWEVVVRSGRLAAPTQRDQVAAQQNREAVRRQDLAPVLFGYPRGAL